MFNNRYYRNMRLVAVSMEQLELDIKVRSHKPIKEVACPCCKQRIRNIETRHLSRQAIRKVLFDNWEALSKDLLQKHLAEPADISLAAHPDLLWALKAEAGYYGLELNDMVSLIIDSWFEGRIKEFHRRGKKLTLPNNPQTNTDSIKTDGEYHETL